MQNRREFLKGTAWMGAAAVAAGCATDADWKADSGLPGLKKY